ncbi:MAG: hypothetical protein M3R06_00125 [Chloroflexota bacterium]|nr:hypothetical protein [Chloroflexota bacterium]
MKMAPPAVHESVTEFSAEIHPVEIPIPPALLMRMGVNAQRLDVEYGGIYDDKISTLAIYDRPWRNDQIPGEARLIGMIFISTRTERVFRIEAYPETGGSFDVILAHLETLLGLPQGEASQGR